MHRQHRPTIITKYQLFCSLIVTVEGRLIGYILAMVEDDSAVGPTIMVDQTQVGKKAYTHGLQPSLVTQCEAITLDLQQQTEGRGHGKSAYRRDRAPITHETLVHNVALWDVHSYNAKDA